MIEDTWQIFQSMLSNLKLIRHLMMRHVSHLPAQKKPSKNAANIDICRASKDVFDKDINFMVSDAEKQDQSSKENSAANDLCIFEENNEK